MATENAHIPSASCLSQGQHPGGVPVRQFCEMPPLGTLCQECLESLYFLQLGINLRSVEKQKKKYLISKHSLGVHE